MADGLEVVASQRQVVEPQHPPRGLVGQLQPAVWIDDDDAFDHAGEDGFHTSVIARLLGELPSHDLYRIVQRPRDAPELVVSVVETGGREVAAAVAFRDAGDRAHAAAHARGDDPADRGRAAEREGERREDGRQHGAKLLTDIGERKCHPDKRDRRMGDRHSDVQHVDVERVAVAAAFAQAVLPGLDHLGARCVVLHAGDALERFRRIANDDAVRRDERHASAHQIADAVGLGVEIRHGRRRRRAGQQLAGEARFRRQRLLDLCIVSAGGRAGEQEPGDRQADRGRYRARREELGLKRHGFSITNTRRSRPAWA